MDAIHLLSDTLPGSQYIIVYTTRYNFTDFLKCLARYNNIRNMTRIAGGTDSQNKIYKMLSFADYEETQRFTEARDVADPWYTGNFDETYEDVVAGCRGFLYYLQQKGELSADVEIPEK